MGWSSASRSGCCTPGGESQGANLQQNRRAQGRFGSYGEGKRSSLGGNRIAVRRAHRLKPDYYYYYYGNLKGFDDGVLSEVHRGSVRVRCFARMF
jgi:hypothetical protein